ncbi:MAG TPA: LLM class flavin-dependent oxidoreductase [Solirubrobacteraceae bacterium]|jgi:coenzyme F420-dependent glucose-6-phosphate dehydrogenase
MTQFWFAASTEEFPPSQMLEQARAAERAGFDGLGASDHFAPWWPDGQGSQAWVTLAAIGQHTTLPLGTGVTPIIHHYHPAVVAQAFMSMQELYPGRVFLGAGSGEALNEVPLGLDWPAAGEMLERFEAGLQAVTRLWDGETVTMDGGWFALKEAKLYTRAASRPKLYVSAFGPQAAQIAARYGDGLWTLGDPESAPEVIDAYLEARARHGREPGEIILQSGFNLAEDEETAIASTRKWKATQLEEVYRDDLHDPGEMLAKAEAEVSDEQFAKEGFIVSADPSEHVERIRQLEEIHEATTTIVLQGIGADPLGSIRRYGEHVLPALRGVRTA